SVLAHASQRVRGKRALKLKPDIDQPKMGSGDTPNVNRSSLVIEGSKLAQVLEAGAVSRRENDRIDRLALAFVPDYSVNVQAFEHGASIKSPLDELRFITSAISDDGAPNDQFQPFGGERVKAGLAEPVVHVFTA